MENVFQIENLTRCFGGLVAVDNVSFEMQARTIHSLIGPNGAGKTTIISMINGTLPVTSGHIHFYGREITDMKTHKISQMGIARTFQNIKLFESLTVEENLMLGGDCLFGRDNIVKFLFTPRRQRSLEQAASEVACEIMNNLEIYSLRYETVSSLAYGRKKVVELARALMSNPKLILLDEPAAGLNPSERREFIEQLHETFESGIDLFIIEHNMDVVMNLSDKITVVNFGKKIAEGTPDEIRNNEQVIKAYLGERYKV
jgi:branched-chain amino acid transport system ATP-binding protein